MGAVYLPASATAISISHNQGVYAYSDIVWSIQYSLTGESGFQGGFVTFLYDSTVSTLTGGGVGSSLAYGPSDNYIVFANKSGVSGAILGIAFDSTGLFSLSGNGFTSGLSSTDLNQLIIRVGSDFTYLTSVSLSTIDPNWQFVKNSPEFETLRFIVTEVGTKLKIARWINNTFTDIFTYTINLSASTLSAYKVGLSYAAPISGLFSNPLKFALKGFHVEGDSTTPSTTSRNFTTAAVLSVLQTYTLIASAFPTTTDRPTNINSFLPVYGDEDTEIDTPDINDVCATSFGTSTEIDRISTSFSVISALYVVTSNP